MSEITIKNIQEEFIKACQSTEQSIRNLLDNPLSDYINYKENDYEIIRLIEQHHPKLLNIVLLRDIEEDGRIQQDNTYIDANTYFCILNEETKKNEDLAFNVLTKGQEYLNLIPDSVKTPSFLESICKEYKKDIFSFDFTYTKEYEKFLLQYVKYGHVFTNNIKFEEELLNDRHFIATISTYPCNIFPLIKNIYQEDKEIMTNIAINSKKAFQEMTPKMRKSISKTKSIAIQIIEKNPLNYQYLHKSMRVDNDCIEKVLSMNPAIYESFLAEIKNNEELTIKLVDKYPINVLYLSDQMKKNKQVAWIMTKKNGKNLAHFPLYEEDPSLVDLALKTFKMIASIPEKQRNVERVKEIVFQANKDENTSNLYYLSQEIKDDREFILEAIKKDIFYGEDIFKLVNDNKQHKEDYELVKECIKKHSILYGRFSNFKEDYEIIHIYIEWMKKQLKGIFDLTRVPDKIKSQASMKKIPVDKYIFGKVMEKQSEEWKSNNETKINKVKKVKI